MPSITIKLPSDLDRRLRAKARRNRETVSATVRRALAPEAVSAPDFATMAADSIGMIKDGPRDLSSREGYDSRR